MQTARMTNRANLVIALVAGEASGDNIGASLITVLKKQYPQALFIGIGGEKMQAAGLQSLYPMATLSVMGLIAPLLRLPQLLQVFYGVLQKLTQLKPAIFIGIDSPDFTLRLAARLKQRGFTTFHVVSPSVWAWRKKRIHAIKQAVDHMFVLFPFEQAIYQDHGVPVTCIGHPLAHVFARTVSAEQRTAIQQQLGVAQYSPLIGLFPGSRKSDLKALLPLLLAVGAQLQVRYPQCQLLLPCPTQALQDATYTALQAYPGLSIKVLLKANQQVMQACDVMVVKSGTATLEGLFCKKKMVVVYRLSRFTYWLAQKLVKVPYISLPNLLANRFLVPELVQDDANVENIVQHIDALLKESPAQTENRLQHFDKIHAELQQDYAEKVLEVVKAKILCN
jgi:lipid-A-disaccharide synthase